MKSLRLGLIGVEGRGRVADYAHRPREGIEIVAGADPSETARARFAARYRERFDAAPAGYADYREMLERERLDGVFIMSPDFCHEEQACEALRRAVAVYLEKPMAITVEGCDRILRAARASGARLMIGHNMRYMEFTRRMKALIDAGTIGEIMAVWVRHFISYGGDAYFRDWHAERKNTTSLLLQKGAHDIDIIHWLAGGITRRVVGFGGLGVYGRLPRRPPDSQEPPDASFNPAHWPPERQSGYNPAMDVEDHNMILMELSNGVQAAYLQCHYTPDAWRNYTVIGTRGRIENYGDYGGACSLEIWTRRQDGYRLRGDQSLPVPPAEGLHGGADGRIVQGFLEYLRDGRRPDIRPQEARHSVAAGWAGAASIRSGGRPVEVPPLAADLEKWDF
jgi:predicted dehydrogenase